MASRWMRGWTRGACSVLLLAAASPALASHLPPGSLAAAARSAGVQIGAAVDSDATPQRLALAGTEFTSMTLENQLKWGQLSAAPGTWDFSRADAQVAWAESRGLRIRGHTLFWDRLSGSPGWLRSEIATAADPAAQLTARMQEHARTVVGRYAGRISQWDVVNEPLGLFAAIPDPDSLYVQTLGVSFLDVAFRAAHAADPSALLYLNEVVADWQGFPQKFDALLALVQGMQSRGVPIDGIGLQGHFFLAPPDRAYLEGLLRRIAALGLQVEFTELDIPMIFFKNAPDPLAAQAQAYADVVAACLAVSACTGITTWGIDDGDTWLDSFMVSSANAPNRPLLFDAMGRPKPAYDAVVRTLLPAPGRGLLVVMALGAVAARARRRRA